MAKKTATTTVPEKTGPIVMLRVDSSGTMLWDEEKLTGTQALIEHLSAFHARRDNPSLRIKASAEAPYKTVIQIMAGAQRIGIHRIGLVSSKESSAK